MSNTVYGRIIVTDKLELYKNKNLFFSLVSFSAKNQFGIQFSTMRKDIALDVSGKSFPFYISDHFLCDYCECFLAPLQYGDAEKKSSEAKLKKDLALMGNLLGLIFRSPYVEKTELYFSDGTAIFSDYKTLETSMCAFNEILFEQYRKENGIPIIKVIVTR